ncbi:hypothetical protein FHG87_008457 [Trinorchestia longiramus]|nr:hypothetical protein FHG87_008457 [Trinorchestia longiramus]
MILHHAISIVVLLVVWPDVPPSAIRRTLVFPSCTPHRGGVLYPRYTGEGCGIDRDGASGPAYYSQNQSLTGQHARCTGMRSRARYGQGAASMRKPACASAQSYECGLSASLPARSSPAFPKYAPILTSAILLQLKYCLDCRVCRWGEAVPAAKQTTVPAKQTTVQLETQHRPGVFQAMLQCSTICFKAACRLSEAFE